MIYPLVDELAAAGILVTVTCRVLKRARQPYYRWKRNPVADAAWLRARRMNVLFDGHADDATLGYRQLANFARRSGLRMSRRTAWALARQVGAVSTSQRSRRGKGKRPGPPVFDDLMKRLFTASGPNRLWLTDLTEHGTAEGKLHCCMIKDAWSNRIVGYSIKPTMHADIVVDAIEHAVARRGNVAGCILHADRGSQFRSQAVARAPHRHDMVGSMGRVASAADNAAMESFWALLQKTVLNQQRRWESRQDLRLAIVTWVERRYHRQREQDGLGGLTPIEFETTMEPPMALVA